MSTRVTIFRAWRKFRNILWEAKLGIDTRGIQQVPEVADNHYGTTDYDSIVATLRFLKMQPSDVFVDIGCGKGRVLCCAARFKLRKVIGIEINDDLVEVARKNCEIAARLHSDIEIINSPAEGVDYRDGTIFYLFQPFSADVLAKVLRRVRLSLDLRPREIRVVYIQPSHDDVLKQATWLERYDHWEPGRLLGMNNAISFWRSRLDAVPATGLTSFDFDA